MFGTLKICRKKCPYCSFCKIIGCNKNVPLDWGRKCWDIPRDVIISVPVEGQRKSWDIPRSVTICVTIEGW